MLPPRCSLLLRRAFAPEQTPVSVRFDALRTHGFSFQSWPPTTALLKIVPYLCLHLQPPSGMEWTGWAADSKFVSFLQQSVYVAQGNMQPTCFLTRCHAIVYIFLTGSLTTPHTRYTYKYTDEYLIPELARTADGCEMIRWRLRSEVVG